MEQALHGRTDLEFLKRVFGKLSANFGWWVNRKDRSGNNLYEGGFLGLDNIGVFDRSAPLPTGGYLEQADGTAWVALYAQNMVEIAVELAAHEPAYEELATNFGMQFLLIARAGSQSQGRGLAALPLSTATLPSHYTTFATGKNQTEEYSNEVEDTRHHRDRGGAGDQRVRLR